MNKLRNIDIPQDALQLLQSIEDAGHSAWIVGGYVRDIVMGKDPHDIDIATSAHWREAKQIFLDMGHKIYETGTDHGTITVNTGSHLIEVTTYRADTSYSNGRHPDEVVFLDSIEDDLARRDFTMNALAYNPQHGLLDPYHGIDDIEGRIIRTVGDPNKRFSEDALRIMRAIRFSSQLGFSIDKTTAQAIHTHAMRLNMIAYERIEAEFSRILIGDHACQSIIDWIDVLGVFIPEARAMKGFDQKTKYHIYDVLEHAAHVVSHAPQKRIVRYAAFFHDIGKPRVFTQDEEGVGHFYGHAPVGADMTRKVLSRLRVKKADTERIVALVAMHQDMIAATPASVRRALHRIQGDVELFRDLLDLKRADAYGHAPQYQDRAQQADEVEAVLDEVLHQEAAFCIQDLAIDGHDVMSCGIPAGPAVGATLDMVLDVVIDGLVENDRDALLSFISDRARNMHR